MNELNHPPVLSRREAKRRDRRDAIICVAQRSFLENGYAATTMSGIAAELGGSKGTLWNYFPSKEELFAAVLRHATKDYHAGLGQILDPRGGLEPTLHRFARELLCKVTSPESIALHRLVVAEAGRYPEMGAIFHELAPKRTRALLSEFLSNAMEQGRLRRADPELAARTLIMLTLTGSHQQMMWGQAAAPTTEQVEADVRFAVDLFLRAYAPGT
jgi:TetR/AcrR family transcriptional regulator, mexJK operon transcriptional repressor